MLLCGSTKSGQRSHTRSGQTFDVGNSDANGLYTAFYQLWLQKAQARPNPSQASVIE